MASIQICGLEIKNLKSFLKRISLLEFLVKGLGEPHNMSTWLVLWVKVRGYKQGLKLEIDYTQILKAEKNKLSVDPTPGQPIFV